MNPARTPESNEIPGGATRPVGQVPIHHDHEPAGRIGVYAGDTSSETDNEASFTVAR